MTDTLVTKLADAIADSLDIPRSYYEKAAARHKSLGEWFCRPASRIAAFNPKVSLQGSFRFGTVTLPIHSEAEYDLDNVTMIRLNKAALTQKQLKDLFGSEVAGYAEAHSMPEPVEETNRCWRLRYSDEVAFHVDALPCLPEEEGVIKAIIALGVAPDLAAVAVAITDKRHPDYQRISRALLTSNPRGFARWFEARLRPWALTQIRKLVQGGFYASVEKVPPYEWKTPLQRSIQILKRHRDVMFRHDPKGAPISMIITNLAAHAYSGESEIGSALLNIVDKMPQYIRPARPRVPNPANPAEDYADKWAGDPTLENNFWFWHTQVRADISNLSSLIRHTTLASEIRRIFAVDLTRDQLREIEPPTSAPAVMRVAIASSVVPIRNAPRPWSDHD
jgi:hypothetical protein